VGLSGDLCNLFRFIKRKNMFMKTDMTGDIHVMRFNVKTSITKVRGTAAKKHTWRRPKIQFMIIIGTQKRKIETSKSTQKMIIRRPLKQTIKWGSIIKNKSRHAINEINRSVKRIIPKTKWSFTLA